MGTHSELLQKKGVYFNLVQAQVLCCVILTYKWVTIVKLIYSLVKKKVV